MPYLPYLPYLPYRQLDEGTQIELRLPLLCRFSGGSSEVQNPEVNLERLRSEPYVRRRVVDKWLPTDLVTYFLTTSLPTSVLLTDLLTYFTCFTYLLTCLRA